MAVGLVLRGGEVEYVFTKELSTGGFGTTYLAQQRKGPTPDRLVAIKVPRIDILRDPVWSKKFAREARILASIDHPNVVKSIGFWEAPPKPGGTVRGLYLIQELVTEAKTLAEFIKESPESAPSLLIQALYALRAFHRRGSPAAVHRDISPRNILVDQQGVLKIIDFGLAKEDPRATEVLTVTGDIFGTPGCMAPEQTENARTVDHRADLYALGRTFAASIQGRNPQHVDLNRLKNPWKTICTKLAAYDPEERYQTAEEALLNCIPLMIDAAFSFDPIRVHAREMAAHPLPELWPALVSAHFANLPTFDERDVADLLGLAPAVVRGRCFSANEVFLRLQQSEAWTQADADSARSGQFSGQDRVRDFYGSLLWRLTEPVRPQLLAHLESDPQRWQYMRALGIVRNGNDEDCLARPECDESVDFEDDTLVNLSGVREASGDPTTPSDVRAFNLDILEKQFGGP